MPVISKENTQEYLDKIIEEKQNGYFFNNLKIVEIRHSGMMIWWKAIYNGKEFSGFTNNVKNSEELAEQIYRRISYLEL